MIWGLLPLLVELRLVGTGVVVLLLVVGAGEAFLLLFLLAFLLAFLLLRFSGVLSNE